MKEQVNSLRKEKDHMQVDLAQKAFQINRLEKQLVDFSARLLKDPERYNNFAPLPQPPGQKPDGRRPTPMSQQGRSTRTSITKANETASYISRPESPGMSALQDELEGKRQRDGRDLRQQKKEGDDIIDEDNPPQLVDEEFEKLPRYLEYQPEDDQELAPLDTTKPITFKELKIRWKQSAANTPTRSELLLMVNQTKFTETIRY
jgi:hypothetical protein